MPALENRKARRWGLTLATVVVAFVVGGGASAGELFAQNATQAPVIEVAAAIEGDADAGANVFRKCQVCHSVEPGQNKVGPSLYGVVGRQAGSVEGFRYSPAMRDSDVVWTAENLDAYLANPRDFMPGNKMVFPGLRSQEDRRDIIAYLAAQGQAEE